MFLTEKEIKILNFKSIGKNVLISDKASIYGAENMSIGNNVRIDDFYNDLTEKDIEFLKSIKKLHINIYESKYWVNARTWKVKGSI